MDTSSQPIPFQAPSIEELGPYFPSYDIEDFIAQGGMGAVYKARQISLDRPVAIKILPREFGQDPEFRDSFEAEAKAMARLNHPNLIGVYDFGEVEGMLFLVMEFVYGKSLYYSSHGKSIDPTQAAEIIIAVCGGLEHAHAADILHRDVKPANILLSQDATPKIGDFGLASPMNETAEADEVVYGTPGYTAPEVIQRLQVDRRADVFSTGVMLHELLTGALPDEQKTPPSILSGCPVAFDAIVTRSTHPSPELRYATAKELANDLTKALQTGPAIAATRLNLTPAASPILPRTSGALAVPVKKSPSLALPLTLLGVVAIGAVVYFTSQNKETPAPVTPTEDIVEAAEPKPVTTTKKAVPTPVTTTKTKPATPPEVKPKKEQPLQALKRLKSKLASGGRDEFPEGTVEYNNSHFLLLAHPLSQQAAIKFAEEHGGHLAIATSPEDKQFLVKSFSPKKNAWIGAGIAAREQWQWMDSSPWNENDQLTSTSANDRAAVLTVHGALMAKSSEQSQHFIIQWRNDGSNPCTLDAQIQRAGESVAKLGIDQARYPVGTRTFEKSHFLTTPKLLTWENALQLAKSHKANLPVPSSAKENLWLTNTFSKKPNEASFWLGGYQLNPSSPWQWTTREAWSSHGWKSGEPKKSPVNNRMMMQISSANQPQSWITTQGEKGEVKSTMLEWSAPKIAVTKNFDLSKWLNGVNRKIKDRVKPDVEAYNKDRKNLIEKYVRSMKRAAKKVDIPGGRGRGGGRNNFIVSLVEEAMEGVEESGELPENIPDRAPDAFHEIHDESKKSLEKLDEDYQAKLKAHLEFYTAGLLKKAAELQETGFNQAASTLKESVDTIGEDTTSFLNTLGL